MNTNALKKPIDSDTVYRELKERIRKMSIGVGQNEKDRGKMGSASKLKDERPLNEPKNEEKEEIIYENWPICTTEIPRKELNLESKMLMSQLPTKPEWLTNNTNFERIKSDQDCSRPLNSQCSSQGSSDQVSDSLSIGEDAKSYMRKCETKLNPENSLETRPLEIFSFPEGYQDPLFKSSKVSNKIRLIDQSEKVALASLHVLTKVEASVKLAVHKMAHLKAADKKSVSLDKVCDENPIIIKEAIPTLPETKREGDVSANAFETYSKINSTEMTENDLYSDLKINPCCEDIAIQNSEEIYAVENKNENLVKRLSCFFAKETHNFKYLLDTLGEGLPVSNSKGIRNLGNNMTVDKMTFNRKKTKKSKKASSSNGDLEDVVLQSVVKNENQENTTENYAASSDSDASWKTEWDDDGESSVILSTIDAMEVAPQEVTLPTINLENDHKKSTCKEHISNTETNVNPKKKTASNVTPVDSIQDLSTLLGDSNPKKISTESKSKNLASLFSTLSFRGNKNAKITELLKDQASNDAINVSEPIRKKLSQIFEPMTLGKSDKAQFAISKESNRVLNSSSKFDESESLDKSLFRRSLIPIPETELLSVSQSISNARLINNSYKRKSCSSAINITSTSIEPLLNKHPSQAIFGNNDENKVITESVTKVESHFLYADHLNLSQAAIEKQNIGLSKKRASSFWNTINAFQGKKLMGHKGKNKSLAQLNYNAATNESMKTQERTASTFFFSPIGTLNAIGNGVESARLDLEKTELTAKSTKDSKSYMPHHSYVNIPGYVNCFNHLGAYHPYYNILPGLPHEEPSPYSHKYQYIYDKGCPTSLRDNVDVGCKQSSELMCHMFYHHYYNCQNCHKIWPSGVANDNSDNTATRFRQNQSFQDRTLPLKSNKIKDSVEIEKDSAISELSDTNSNNSTQSPSSSRIPDPQVQAPYMVPPLTAKILRNKHFTPNQSKESVKSVDWKRVSEQAATLAAKMNQFHIAENVKASEQTGKGGNVQAHLVQMQPDQKLYSFADSNYINSISPPCHTPITSAFIPSRCAPFNNAFEHGVPSSTVYNCGTSEKSLPNRPCNIPSRNENFQSKPMPPRKIASSSFKRQDRYRRSSRSSIGKIPFSPNYQKYAKQSSGLVAGPLISPSLKQKYCRDAHSTVHPPKPIKPVQRKWFTVRTARKSKRYKGTNADTEPMRLQDLFRTKDTHQDSLNNAHVRASSRLSLSSDLYYDPSVISIGACSLGSGHSSAHSSSHSSKTFWHALPEVVNSLLLAKMTAHEIQLQEALYEIISSEKSYLKSLNVLVEHFYYCPDFVSQKNKPKTSIISQQEKHYLFSNITAVRDASRRLVNDLGERWLKDGLVVNDICDIIIRHCLMGEEGLDVYVKYCTNQSYQFRALKYLKENNSYFLRVLKGLEKSEKCQGLSMYSYLILPMQRITRLPLLVKSVFDKRLPNTPEFFNAQQALQLLNNIVSRCNTGARSMERVEQLIYIARNLKFKVKKIPMVSTARHLIKQGDLTCLSSFFNVSNPYSGGKEKIVKLRIHLILFNDLLLITKKKGTTYEVNDYCPKDYVDIRNIDDSESTYALSVNIPFLPERHLFVLVMLKNHENKFYQLTLECLSKCEKEDWIEALKNPEFQYENI